MVRTTANSARTHFAAQLREATHRRASATPAQTPRRSPTLNHDSPPPNPGYNPGDGGDDDPDDLYGGGNPGGGPGGGNGPPDGNPGGNPGGGDGGPPDDDPDPESDDDDEDNADNANLAVAINKLAKSVNRPSESKTKACEPDTFDGQDPKKLRNFQVQCELNFRDRRKAFRSDKNKVTYALTYLRGAALEWFEPAILEGLHPDWEDDYSVFMDELQTNFGPFDPIGDAETDLESLKMGEGQKFIKFVIVFNRLSSLVDWNDQALRHSFYRALPNRIKDEIARVQRPNTLIGLKALARQIDSRYWRRQEEIKRENKSKPSTTSQDKSNNNNNKSSKNTSTSATSSTTPKTSSTSTSTPSGSGNSASSSKKTTEDLSNKLGKDGKLTTDERNRRITNNLCLFCGGTGHRASECKKAAKARAAKVKTESADTKSASDSKK
jgi:hypothetical protein